jgi:hypothetical protein
MAGPPIDVLGALIRTPAGGPIGGVGRPIGEVGKPGSCTRSLRCQSHLSKQSQVFKFETIGAAQDGKRLCVHSRKGLRDGPGNRGGALPLLKLDEDIGELDT